MPHIILHTFKQKGEKRFLLHHSVWFVESLEKRFSGWGADGGGESEEASSERCIVCFGRLMLCFNPFYIGLKRLFIKKRKKFQVLH